jgi:hypothetical protein
MYINSSIERTSAQKAEVQCQRHGGHSLAAELCAYLRDVHALYQEDEAFRALVHALGDDT